ncbi:MAG: HK97 family phage prohead protease [Treponema sp.]|jgi:HK97 family phage prohead protease|nr:HK97 family phage prohead protease [Treponema sp.]
MIIRMKNGEYHAGSASVLLEYLGLKKEASDQWPVGIQKVAGNVELIASVPFLLTADIEAGEGFPWTLSTYHLDCFGERIDPKGWDFKRYMDNPVVEWAHLYHVPAIGKIEGLIVDDVGLHGLVFFNSKDFDPFGWAIGQRVKAGVIRAGSVGFRVKEIEIPSKEDSRDGTSLIFRKQELLEFSICNVPANPFALAKRNEELEIKKETGNNANPFWGSFINNLQGE